MKKHLDKIFLILGFFGTMLCTSYTIYSNINKFNSSLKKINNENKKEITDDDFEEDDEEEIEEDEP